jgi:hypothetical protein
MSNCNSTPSDVNDLPAPLAKTFQRPTPPEDGGTVDRGPMSREAFDEFIRRMVAFEFPENERYMGPRGELLSGPELKYHITRLRGPTQYRACDKINPQDLSGWFKVRCPICGEEAEKGPCYLSPSGTVVACLREQSGAVGVTGWGYDPKDPTPPWLMNVHLRNARVRMDVNGKPLLEKHHEDLEASGLSEETIRAAGIYSEADPGKIAAMLGWKKAPGPLGPVLVIPYLDMKGAPTGHYRVKPDFPRWDSERRRTIKYESPKGATPLAYYPPKTRAVLKDPSVPLILTEGEKKALKADQEGFPTVGLPGVWSFQKKRPRSAVGRAEGARKLIDSLKGVVWKDRKVYVVFDSDAAHNRNVRDAEDALVKVLQRKGADVHVVRLPGGVTPDGRQVKVGLDDYLDDYGKEALRDLLEDAKPERELDRQPSPAAALIDLWSSRATRRSCSTTRTGSRTPPSRSTAAA